MKQKVFSHLLLAINPYYPVILSNSLPLRSWRLSGEK